jgi:hypothetical protein
MAVCSPCHLWCTLRCSISWHGFCGCSLMSCLELLPVLQMQLVAAEELQELNSNVVRVPHTELVRALSPALVVFPNFVDYQRCVGCGGECICTCTVECCWGVSGGLWETLRLYPHVGCTSDKLSDLNRTLQLHSVVGEL